MGVVIWVVFVAREVADEAIVPSAEDVEVVEVKDDSEEVREAGDISCISEGCGVNASREESELTEDRDLVGEEVTGRRAYATALGSISIPPEVLEVRGEP